MGAKKVLPPAQVMSNLAVSGTNTYISATTFVENLDNILYQIEYSNGVNGTFTIMASADGVIFDPLTFSPSLQVAAGTADHFQVSINQQPFRYMYIQFVSTSGSGTITAYIYGKDLN